MNKVFFALVFLIGQISFAKIIDFNSLIQQESSAQKEIHSSLSSDIQVIEVSSAASETPEIIVLGAGQVSQINQKNDFQLLQSSAHQKRVNPIAVEQIQFQRLGEELSEAQ